MGGFRFTFSVEGETQVDRTLTRFADNIKDARPVWDKLAGRFARLERRQFAGEGTFSGGWAPLSPAYAAWKARHYPGKPILERTGELKRDLTERPLAIEVLEPGFLLLGTAREYGEFHQRGAGDLPQRRPIEFPEGERREWVKVLQRFIVTGKATR